MVLAMTMQHKESMLISRRAFIGGVAAASAALAVKPAFALSGKDTRALAFYHTHTGEEMNITYFANGGYVKDGLKRVNYLLRDFRNNQQATIDPQLLDKLVALQRKLGSTGKFEIISAYRSPQTNAMLHAHSSGVASKSYHIQGKAIDIRLSDSDIYRIHNAALAMGNGGVGLYRGSDFVHLDTGPVRHWG